MVGIPGTQRGTSAPINLDKHKIKGSDEIKSPFVNFNECKFQFVKCHCKGERVSACRCVVVVGGVDADSVDRLKIKVLSRFSIVLHRNFRHHKECKS